MVAKLANREIDDIARHHPLGVAPKKRDRLIAQVTFVVFTFNEERRIERVLRNFAGRAPVLVVDNFSNDATVAIAERHGAAILLNQNSGWVEDEITVAAVKAAVTTPWIYWGYADEMLSRSTLDLILTETERTCFDVIRIARKNYYYGRFCYDSYISFTNRVFRKDAIDFVGNVIHQFGRVVQGARIMTLDSSQHFVHHFISNTAQSYIKAIDRYSDTEAATSKNPGRLRFGPIVKSLVGNYVLRGGYRAGLPGFFLAVQTAYYALVVQMKIFEHQNHLDVAAIEAENDIQRDRILGEFAVKAGG